MCSIKVLCPLRCHCRFINIKFVDFMMNSSYEVFLPSQPDISPLPERRGRSLSFLTSIKSLVRGSLSRSRSPRRLQASNEGKPEREISQMAHDKRQGHLSSTKYLKPHVWPRRRRRRQVSITSVADYLTLAQLENVWRQQDRSRGDAETARQSQQQKLGQPVTGNMVRQSIPSSEIHPAFRSRQSSSPEDSDGPAASCKDPLAVARYM